ncbi:MAG: hypothetical protein KKB59_19955 [Spirochaetes bacterium]|nr:hypothetical protein [Spirochaetota bacterium]
MSKFKVETTQYSIYPKDETNGVNSSKTIVMTVLDEGDGVYFQIETLDGQIILDPEEVLEIAKIAEIYTEEISCNEITKKMLALRTPILDIWGD